MTVRPTRTLKLFTPAFLFAASFSLASTASHAAVLSFNATDFPANGSTTSFSYTDVDGTNVDIDFNAAIGAGSEFFNGSPEFDNPSSSSNFNGALQFQVRTTSATFDSTAATATVTLTFSEAVQDLSFSFFDIEAQNTGDPNARAESVTVTTDNGLANISLVGGSSVSVSSNTATGIGPSPIVNASTPIQAAGLVDVTIDGPINVLTLSLANIPDSGATSNGGSLFGLSDITFTPVPEPASLSLLALGGLLITSRRRSD